MPLNLRGRSILTLEELSAEEIRFLLQLAADLKVAKRAGTEEQQLLRKNIALIFEKDSTRTRTGFEVAAYDQGAHVTYLGPSGSHIGHKESMKDTARVLGRMYDAIEYRGFAQSLADELAANAGVPVYNGLTNEAHPTQVLADFMTMREFTHKHLSDCRLAFLGDGRDNVAHTLAVGCAKVGIDMTIASPRSLWPEHDVVLRLNEQGEAAGGSVLLTDDALEAVKGADFIYTDVWLSMGEDERAWEKRITALIPYRVTSDIMAASGNPHAKFMHCLPAFHNTATEVGADIQKRFGIDCMEVTEDVFESPASIVFDQAENRMHTIKAILVATIAG